MTEVQGKRFKVQGWMYVLHLTLPLEPCPFNLEPLTLDLNHEY